MGGCFVVWWVIDGLVLAYGYVCWAVLCCLLFSFAVRCFTCRWTKNLFVLIAQSVCSLKPAQQAKRSLFWRSAG